jgi:hypothetical protein
VDSGPDRTSRSTVGKFSIDELAQPDVIEGVTVVSEDGARDASSRGNPSKRFWGYFFAFWIVLAVVALIGQSWWNLATASIGILFTAMQWRNAPDKPR